ncbi:MAG: hypothetical protein ACJKTH_00945 [Patescibacteria group bacterium UBA2163]
MRLGRLRFFAPLSNSVIEGVSKSAAPGGILNKGGQKLREAAPSIKNSGDLLGLTVGGAALLALSNKDSREFLFDSSEGAYDFFTGSREGFVEAAGTTELWTTPEMGVIYAFIAIAIADRLGFQPLKKV